MEERRATVTNALQSTTLKRISAPANHFVWGEWRRRNIYLFKAKAMKHVRWETLRGGVFIDNPQMS
jgi:hypothetical protein